MKWQPSGDYAQICGDYAICKTKVQGRWICSLWRISNQRDVPSEKLAQGTYREMLEAFERETRGLIPPCEP